MPKIQKVTDPQRQVTDPALLFALVRRGIDKDYVEFVQDYAPAFVNGKRVKERSPYAKFYRDLKSNKKFAVISQLPMVDADSNKVEVGWQDTGLGSFIAKNNLFQATVSGSVNIVVKNDQPDGRKQGDQLIFTPQVFLDGIERLTATPILLAIDPINPNYSQNVLEWDYGICRRRLRIIEGKLLGSWIFFTNPNGEVRLKYNQIGDYNLKLGRFQINNDEELIPSKAFADPDFGYPFTINDTSTFYPDASAETSSVDGYAVRSGVDQTWANIRVADGITADDEAVAIQLHSMRSSTTNNQWSRISRGIILFDVSALPATAVISAVTLSLYGQGKRDELSIAHDINVFASTPATNTAVVAADLTTVGTTAFSTAITYANWLIASPFWNDFILNATGIAFVQTAADGDGIVKLGTRNVNYDLNAQAPAWSSNLISDLACYAAEQGNGYKPKLIVTYIALFQTVGSGAITPTGALSASRLQSVGNGAIAIAGVLGRLIKIAVGAGSITPTGALTAALKLFQTVGQGAVAIAGSLSTISKYLQNVGSGVITPVGALTSSLIGRILKVVAFTSTYRLAKAMTALYRKIKAFTSGG